MRKSVRALALHGFLAGLSFALFSIGVVPVAAQELVKLPYVPTPQKVVDEMIKLGEVKATDYVIDLGSGDGRIIITAAKTAKARGLGVDIDSKLVELSNSNAKSAGVADRAEFVERDMFKTDISKASVLMLYVLPEFMQRLRSKVQNELKPGTRVVAHDYHMGDWYPDRIVELTVPEKIEANGTDKAYLYLWVVPTMVQGSWNVQFEPAGKVDPLIFAFNQNYQMISGAVVGPGQPKIEDSKLNGDEISFTLTMRSTPYQFTGKIMGNTIEGKALAAGAKEAMPWKATKAK
ncbi:MAG: methyltransferase domain-containing protein [Deltaproteobacteria bacterium]|nr:methyltransferase domain-containing protein [Deltaproteobacteria bacterium]